MCVFKVSNVQARAARLSWVPPAGLVNRLGNGMPVSCSFEVSLSDKGRDGKYRLIYRWEIHQKRKWCCKYTRTPMWLFCSVLCVCVCVSVAKNWSTIWKTWGQRQTTTFGKDPSSFSSKKKVEFCMLGGVIFPLRCVWFLDVLLICFRVSAMYNSVRGSCSEAGSFTTHCSVPDVPLSPKLSHRTKSTLTLQWKVKAQIWPCLDTPFHLKDYSYQGSQGSLKSLKVCELEGEKRPWKLLKTDVNELEFICLSMNRN